MSLLFGLSANNSSGRQTLIFDGNGNGTVNITLIGDFSGKSIQIDFDELPPNDVDHLTYLLKKAKNETK